MRTPSLLAFSALAAAACATADLTAQSNIVNGLDGRLSRIDNLTYYGRRGPSYPNGEVGMAMLNTMCNPGSVNIPWFQAMNPDHPVFGFMVARVANDRIEQVSNWSYCKHAWLSVNVNGACGSCQNPGTGSLMGINCSDTYGAGNNAARQWLGPPSEIDPWLGEWSPIGSYFDIGDPSQAGYPLAADGVRSLNPNIFDDVQHRVTVQEADLVTPGASYYYGLQLVHEGESLANRGDNMAHRGMTPSWNGSQWSFGNNAAAQTYGSVLDRWPGASVTSAHNGNDDGRFFVGVKATPLGGGLFHYEYAVHNVDNSRAGSALHIPLPAGIVVSNLTFGDIDDDGSNDWSAQQVGSEVVFSAGGNSQPLEWNTIYNFGFDADVAPGSGDVVIDEARPGPGMLSVSVPSTVPGGVIQAAFETFAAGCPGSVLAPFSCPELNGSGGTLNGNTNQFEYTYRVDNTDSITVSSFDIYTESNNGTLNRPAHIYPDVGGQPGATPLATTTITVGTQPGFYTATFSSPVALTGTFYVGYENSPDGVISNLTAGTPGIGFFRGSGGWSQSGLVDFPSYRVSCTSTQTFLTPAMGIVGQPELGTAYSPAVSDALANTFAVLVSGLSDQVSQGLPLPLAIPGAPGCDLLVSTDVLDLAITDASGDAQSPINVPNDPTLAGLSVYHQWAIWEPTVNSLSIVMSNGGNALVGF
ncbi:MAG: hypothetical protein AB8H80_03330 [Planctomycetota bacterium]